jgi:acyl-coenzyme A synthetase/AMP-(fatty) acid ligase
VPLSPGLYAKAPELLDAACVSYVIVFDENDGHVSHHRPGASDHPLFRKLRATDAPGLVIFTSGSTGVMKGAVHAMGRLLAPFRAPRAGQVGLAFLLNDHIGGVNTLFSFLCHGGTAVCLRDRRSETVCQAVETHGVNVLPVTPTFLRMLLVGGAYRRYDLSSLKVVSYGTEPMPEPVLRALQEALPKVRFKQMYGLTELSILPTRSRTGDSHWIAMHDSVETKVVDGRLWVRAPTAMLGYLHAGHGAGEHGGVGEDGWYDTGDRVQCDGDYLRVLGRDADLINVGGEKVFPAEVESVLLALEGVEDATVYGRRSALMGQVVAADVTVAEGLDTEAMRLRIRQHCARLLDAQSKVPAVVRFTQQPSHGPRYKKVRRTHDG